ncbi:hypothetical protein MVEN_00920700 [Mycena venus]|uniref:Endonuclease/exonuclease/phosphatase domain-containing protein n=1 Tax=Mycena venus TaxID=2733690 RepID=A0A8H7D1G8_9AGAR|nr:hypothetical protein MVEN_00920700 [Mycena venus]
MSAARSTSEPPADMRVVKPLPKLKLRGPRAEDNDIPRAQSQPPNDGRPAQDERPIPVFNQPTVPPAPPSSSDRSMVAQTERTFTSRTRTDAPPAPKAPVARSESIIVNAEPAPSDVEVYAQTGLTRPPRNEPAKDHRERTDANQLALAVWVLRHQRLLEELRSEVGSKFKETLHRVEDMQRGQGTSIGSGWEDIILENRGAIEGLTHTVNDLQDTQTEFLSFRRQARLDIVNLQNATKDRPLQVSGVRRRAEESPERDQGSSKRARDDGQDKDRHSDRHDTVSQNDIHFWPVDEKKIRENGGPKQIALKALQYAKIDPKHMYSARAVPGLADTISIRFRDFATADSFIQAVRAEPEGMAGRNAMLAAASSHGKGKNKAAQRQNEDKYCLRILAWNIHGRLALKLSHEEICEIIRENDVSIFQETFLRPGDEDCVDLPPGYSIVSMARPNTPDFHQAWGGLAAVISDSVEYTVRHDLSAPDMIVIEFETFFLIGVYLPPVGSPWIQWSPTDPEQRLEQAVTVCTATTKYVVVEGDLNGRIGDKTSKDSVLGRYSLDPVVNTRGRWILRLCNDCGLTVVNGTVKEESFPGAFTSFQPLGRTVIDFALVSNALVDYIPDKSLRVRDAPNWSDHSQLWFEVPTRGAKRYKIPKATSVPIQYAPETELDRAAARLLTLTVTAKEATRRLYGSVLCNSNPVSVYMAASGRDAGKPYSKAGALKAALLSPLYFRL